MGSKSRTRSPEAAVDGGRGAGAEAKRQSVTAEMLIALAIFIAVLVLILTEKAHRTILAMVGAVVMVAVGKLMGFYHEAEALRAIDFNTIGPAPGDDESSSPSWRPPGPSSTWHYGRGGRRRRGRFGSWCCSAL